jgi:hypothetical protein
MKKKIDELTIEELRCAVNLYVKKDRTPFKVIHNSPTSDFPDYARDFQACWELTTLFDEMGPDFIHRIHFEFDRPTGVLCEIVGNILRFVSFGHSSAEALCRSLLKFAVKSLELQVE